MDANIQKYYDSIKDLKTQNEFNEEIQQRKKQYDNLFTEEVIAYLIVDELERNKHCTTCVKDIHAGMESTINGGITEISDTKTFIRKNKSMGKLRKFILTDETGSIPVILWNEDTGLIQEEHMHNGSMITVINGYSKKGYNGIEINVGRWSKVNISESTEPKNKKDHPKEKQIIDGKIESIQPTNIFFKEDGTEGFIAKILLKINNKIQTIVCWNEQVKNIQQYKKGDQITIKNVSYRYSNGEQEIHVNGNAIISK